MIATIENGKAKRGINPQERRCQSCRAVFATRRLDARYCSEAGRMKAYRKRKRRGGAG